MTTYLISISHDGKPGAEWSKRRCINNEKYQLYQGPDQLNTLLDTETLVCSKEFIKEVKSKIKELINTSNYKSAYEKKLAQLDDSEHKFIIIKNVGPHRTDDFPEGIALAECQEFAHVDEITDRHVIDGLKQMNRLYICSKTLTKTKFINRNFPDDAEEIDLLKYCGVLENDQTA